MATPHDQAHPSDVTSIVPQGEAILYVVRTRRHETPSRLIVVTDRAIYQDTKEYDCCYYACCLRGCWVKAAKLGSMPLAHITSVKSRHNWNNDDDNCGNPVDEIVIKASRSNNDTLTYLYLNTFRVDIQAFEAAVNSARDRMHVPNTAVSVTVSKLQSPASVSLALQLRLACGTNLESIMHQRLCMQHQV
eukprot:TRINITY_DN12636_c1_g1_i3.p3 TRINITY_DN12636_c1_g1~~TRINITY_DN12636_c1_g1_i3.p3  ORF type:complete len:190 (+),score=25.40 TRINITY_DN12636_c1_g1_i3:193-762(+)